MQPEKRPFFVAEFTTNHMGNLNLLLRMVERAAWAGADAIKMQKKDVETFYTKEKLDAPYASAYGRTYRDYRTIFEFGEEDFARFDRSCRDHGIEWFCTVQDSSSLDSMLRFGLKRYKVASSNARNHVLLEEIAARVPRDRTIVISVAGSTLPEIEQTLAIFPEHRIWLQHCVAQYPCPPEALRLGNIAELARRFRSERIRIGYSGHEEGIAPTFAAIDQGAEVVERHFCVSRHSFVHHIECSLEPEEYRTMVRTVREGRRPGDGVEDLPREAYAVGFGMTDVEKSFLVEQTYGRKYVGSESRFEPSRPGPRAAAGGARKAAAASGFGAVAGGGRKDAASRSPRGKAAPRRRKVA